MGRASQSNKTRRPYATIEPHTRHVSEKMIRKKWKKLNNSSQDRLRQLFLSIRVQAAVSQDKRKNHGGFEEAVDRLADRLLHRMPHMPFPPSTEDSHFDFEACVDRIRLLENQLTVNMNSMHLLRQQIRKEEKMLHQDQKDLQTLEHACKSSEALQKRQSKNLHPMVEILVTDDANGYDSGQTQQLTSVPSLVEHELAPEEQPLIQQLRDHLDSIAKNVDGISNVSRAMADAKAALDVFVAKSSIPARQAEP